MKILIINTYDIQGGAARAAYRLHKALLAEGIDSQMLVQTKLSDDFTVIGPNSKYEKAIAKIRPYVDRLPLLLYKKRRKTLFSPSWLGFSNVVRKINEIKPDIVHLHWITDGMIKIEDILKIKAPIVWSLHDNWVFTGGCHYTGNCDRYKFSCGRCPNLGSSKENDLSRKIWQRKKNIFSKVPNLTIIGLSRWITDCAKESSLLKDKKIVNLPNPIDTTIFKPFNRKYARELWNLPINKKIILFGAVSATSDIRKGFRELMEALNKLKSRNVELVVFGSSKPKESESFGFITHYVGRLYDDISLVTLYNAVDVTVVPSLQENLSNVIMESLSCGTPVVAFNIGGNSDMIEHQRNGYLAKPYDTDDLAYGIDWVLNNSQYNNLSQYAREKILYEFDFRIVAKKYIELYRSILNDADTRIENENVAHL